MANNYYFACTTGPLGSKHMANNYYFAYTTGPLGLKHMAITTILHLYYRSFRFETWPITTILHKIRRYKNVLILGPDKRGIKVEGEQEILVGRRK